MRQRESVVRHHVLVTRLGPAYDVMRARPYQAKAANRGAAQVPLGLRWLRFLVINRATVC